MACKCAPSEAEALVPRISRLGSPVIAVSGNHDSSLIMRRLAEGESLWDVAKQYRTDETLLRTVNQLEGEDLPDKMLLIPRVR